MSEGSNETPVLFRNLQSSADFAIQKQDTVLSKRYVPMEGYASYIALWCIKYIVNKKD